MTKIGTIGLIGIGLIILSIVIFSVSVVFPQVLTPLAPLFCTSGDQLTVVKNVIGDRASLICVSLTGAKSDVTIAVSRVLGVIYGGLMVLGIVLLTIPRFRQSRQSRYNASLRTAQVFNAVRDSRSDGLQRGVIRFGGQEISLDDLKSGAYQQQAAGNSQRTLADTLSQLEDAHKRGLLNDDEYGHLRQNAINKLV